MLALHGLLHLLGYDHDTRRTRGRMARSNADCARKGGLRAGLIERARADDSAAAVPARDRRGLRRHHRDRLQRADAALAAPDGRARRRDDRLGFYLDDPIQLFMPARLLLGMIFSLATVLIAVLTGRTGFHVARSMLLVFVAVFILVCEHVLPLLIVRRNPERVLEVLLPPFDVVARSLSPITGGLRAAADRRGRPRSADSRAAAGRRRAGKSPHAYLEAGEEQGLIEGDERRLLQSIVDFGDTLVREVMTPRPDIVAIQADATIDAAARALPRAGVLAVPGLQGESRQHPRHASSSRT